MYYLGLDLGGTNIVAAVIDEEYQIISKETIPTNAGRSVEEVTADMAAISRKAVVSAGLTMAEISSWGIGMPSYINPKTDLLVYSNNFGWKNVPIGEHLKRQMPELPIYTDNDANCAIYGEVLAGSAKEYSNAIMLTLGTGIGGGIVIDNKIYSGADNMGAELGHTRLVYNGELCTCTQKGCLEAYCSSTALIRDAKRAVAKSPSSMILEMCKGDSSLINGEIVFEAAKEGDPVAKSLIDNYIDCLAAGIANFVAIFRPEVVIIGGGMAHAGDFLLEPLNRRVSDYTYAGEMIGAPKVIRAELGNDAGLIGAALLEKQK